MQVYILRSQPQSGWHMKTVQSLLQGSDVDMAALLERHEVISACQQQLDKLPKPVGMDSTCYLLCNILRRANQGFKNSQEAVSCISNAIL